MLGQVNLQLTLVGAGMASEHIEDQCSAVNDLDLQGCFQVALLSGGQFVVEDYNVGLEIIYRLGQLPEFPFSDVGGGKPVGPLGNPAHHLRPGGTGQVGQLAEGVFQPPHVGLASQFDSYEDGAFGFLNG